MKFNTRQLNIYAWYLKMDKKHTDSNRIKTTVKAMAFSQIQEIDIPKDEAVHPFLIVTAIELIYKKTKTLNLQTFDCAKRLYDRALEKAKQERQSND